jgi:hypothetical protein
MRVGEGINVIGRGNEWGWIGDKGGWRADE